MKRMFALMLSACMATTAFVGCGSQTGSTEEGKAESTNSEAEMVAETTEAEEHNPVTISITYAGGDETTVATLQKMFAEFEETYPYITLQQDASTSGSYDDYVSTLANTGEFPDIIEMRSTQSYAEAGYIAPIPDSVVDLLADPVAINGEYYTVCMTGNTPHGILYNKDYLASLGYTDIPAVVSWDEFMAMCDAIEADGTMDTIAVGGADQWHMGFWFNKFYNDYVIKNNEDFIADVYAGDCSWLDEEPRQVIEAMVDFWQYVGEGWSSTGDADLATLLVNNQAAMYYSGTWMFTTIEEANPDFNYGYFAVTDPEGWLSIVGGSSSSGWALSTEAAADPDKVAAYETLMTFLLSPDVYVEYLEALSQVYSTKSPVTYDGVAAMDTVYKIMDSADDSRLMWNNQEGDLKLPDGFRNYVYKTVQEVLAGTTDIDTAMVNIQDYWVECVTTAAE